MTLAIDDALTSAIAGRLPPGTSILGALDAYGIDLVLAEATEAWPEQVIYFPPESAVIVVGVRGEPAASPFVLWVVAMAALWAQREDAAAHVRAAAIAGRVRRLRGDLVPFAESERGRWADLARACRTADDLLRTAPPSRWMAN